MEMKEAIKGRRSIRKFDKRQVTKEDVEQIVELARFAPSWRNSQTTRYRAIFDKQLKDKIANEGLMGHENNKKNIDRASVIVVVSTVKGISGYEEDGRETTSKGSHWQSFDAGIATQTFCLAAYERGIGSLILGIIDAEKIKELLGLPGEEEVSTVLCLGYPEDGEVKPAPKRKEISDLLFVYEG